MYCDVSGETQGVGGAAQRGEPAHEDALRRKRAVYRLVTFSKYNHYYAL